MQDDNEFNNICLGYKQGSALDALFSDNNAPGNGGMRGLTDLGRADFSAPIGLPAGARVAFVSNVGSVLQFRSPPDDGSLGTVVMVRTPEGDQACYQGLLFVKFDSGQFLQVDPQFLREIHNCSKKASSYVLKVSSLGDLSGFLVNSNEANSLIHKSSNDLWSFEEDDDGNYKISRLFDGDGTPLKA